MLHPLADLGMKIFSLEDKSKERSLDRLVFLTSLGYFRFLSREKERVRRPSTSPSSFARASNIDLGPRLMNLRQIKFTGREDEEKAEEEEEKR